jgi:kynureninase
LARCSSHSAAVHSYKAHFSRFFAANPRRLHAAAHSHHLWPDVTYEAHLQAWNDAAALADKKWELVLDELMPELRGRIARLLDLPNPQSIAFAQNTHELVVRLRSALPRQARIITTDSEFHSFNRQVRRWEEEGDVVVLRVPVEPFASFPERLIDAVGRHGHDLIYLSQVFFNSGYVVPRDLLDQLVAATTAPIVLDAYHGFVAVPTHVATLAQRVFYLAGGYKYAMSGEGACFMTCPESTAPRPVNTGWFAGFGELTQQVSEVAYAADGMRFGGATFDPSGLYRMNAVLRWLDEIELTVVDIHDRVQRLQRRFIDAIDVALLGELILGRDAAERGHFLTFRTPRAAAIERALREDDVVVDSRADRLRIGFGLYHDPEDIDELAERVARQVGRLLVG